MVDRVVVSDPEILNGTPCFQGTRVPFRNLIDYLQGGHPMDEFLRQFPRVSKEQAIRGLEEAKEALFAVGRSRFEEAYGAEDAVYERLIDVTPDRNR